MYANRGKNAFSLPEVIIALGVIAGAFLVMAALFTQLLRTSQKDSDTTTATLLAQKVLTERLQAIYGNLEPGLSKEQFFSQNSPPAPPLEGELSVNKTVYYYQIRHQTLLDASGAEVGGDPGNNNRLKKVDLTIWWGGEGADDVRAGTGSLKTGITRVFNENSTFEI